MCRPAAHLPPDGAPQSLGTQGISTLQGGYDVVRLSYLGRKEPGNRNFTPHFRFKVQLRTIGVSPALNVVAQNLGNLWRCLVLPQRIGKRSLTSLEQRLVKTGGRLVKHARYDRFLLAESHLTGHLFGSIVRRIELLPLPAG